MSTRASPLRSCAVAILIAASLLAGAAALAVEPDEVLPDPALEARARHLSSELRCLVCQNQSIDDSAAPLAKDLRVIVRERLKAGDSDDAVRDFVVARYGKFVLLKPPLGWDTVLLWAAPFALLVLIVLGLSLRLSRRRSSSAETSPLSREEQARLDRLLNDHR
jgi:cytochrome c-type biogenesis protein CcmH